MVAPDSPTQRIDKWLWFVRVAKTRTLAATLVAGGKVRVNRIKIGKPSQTVKPGDVVTVTTGPRVRVLRVVAGGARRGPATEARGLYEELTPAQVHPKPSTGAAAGEPVADTPVDVRGYGHLPASSRPNKRERRQIVRLKGKSS